jgi:hypothetical protein
VIPKRQTWLRRSISRNTPAPLRANTCLILGQTPPGCGIMWCCQNDFLNHGDWYRHKFSLLSGCLRPLCRRSASFRLDAGELDGRAPARRFGADMLRELLRRARTRQQADARQHGLRGLRLQALLDGRAELVDDVGGRARRKPREGAHRARAIQHGVPGRDRRCWRRDRADLPGAAGLCIARWRACSIRS